MTVDRDALEAAGRAVLIAIGEDPDRDGLQDTPARWARWWAEFIDHDAGRTDTAFDVEHADEMVTVRGITVWSLCEHHLLPFRCTVTVGYIPEGRVLGLSKFARLAHAAAHRLQVQERLVLDLANAVEDATGSRNVAVVADGEHLCMTMRGVRSPATMRTSVMRGAFLTPETRAEFMGHVNGTTP